MTQEEKSLLLRDLCARLPYKVKLQIEGLGNQIIGDKGIRTIASVLPSRNAVEYDMHGSNVGVMIDFVKPYLRSVSNMTEGEKEYMEYLHQFRCNIGYAANKVDFCLKRHLDYRGLIDKGLALEAPEGMYNI